MLYEMPSEIFSNLRSADQESLNMFEELVSVKKLQEVPVFGGYDYRDERLEEEKQSQRYWW